MARPKKESYLSKGKQVTVRLSDVEYEMIQDAARESGNTVAGYIRHQAVLGKIEIHYDIKVNDKELNEIAKELHAIGNNLNQIAKFFNTGGLASQAVREDIDKAADALAGIHERMTNWSKDRYGSIETHRP